MGPNYHQPSAPAGAGYTATLPHDIPGADVAGGEQQTISLGKDISGQWWALFRSPALTALVDRALRGNPSLQAAQATLLQARESARVQEGALFPALSAAFGVTHQQESAAQLGGFSATRGTPDITAPFDLYNATINVNYGLDLWGGVRRGAEQSRAQADEQKFVLEAAYLSLTANVVAAAIAEASLRAQIDATKQVVHAEQDALRVVSAQLAAGAVTRAVVLQQQAQLQTTLATLPPLQSQLAQEHNLLASYMGVTPNQFDEPDFTLDDLSLPTDLPLSLPSALVAQRPDIRQSAAVLHQRTAAVGVATANLLPQVPLTGSVGSDAIRLATLFASGSLAYTLTAQITQPLFQGGALIHQRRGTIAAMQAAADNYQATVVNAFANVADALQALQFDGDALRVSLDAAHSAQQSVALLRVQYSSGAIDNLAVLNAQQTEQTALVTLARVRAARFADTVALFQSLGGGWWNRADVSPATLHCCRLLP